MADVGKSAKGFSYTDEAPNLEKHNNHMANTLKANPGMYEKMAALTTPGGYTFDMAIQTGVDNPGHPHIMTVGATAGDEETYTTWKPFFDEVISRRHNGYPGDGKQPTNMDPSQLKHDGFDEKYVLSARVRTGRSIRGLAMPPGCTRAERREVAKILCKAFETLGEKVPELKGKYEDLAQMTEERQEELIGKHLMFDKPVSPLLLSGGMARDWPDSRGVYLAESERFIIWVNEEDHMRIVSMQMNGNMKEVFTRFCNATNAVEALIKEQGKEYMHNDHLGYVLACPSNLGTGIRAGCHVKLEKLSQHAKFGEILGNLRLQKRGTGGVDTASKGGIFDISNNDRLGFGEVDLVQMVCSGIDLLVAMEKKLEAGESIDDMVPEPIVCPWQKKE